MHDDRPSGMASCTHDCLGTNRAPFCAVTYVLGADPGTGYFRTLARLAAQVGALATCGGHPGRRVWWATSPINERARDTGW